MPQFTGGPSVRVTPNASVEFKWITDVTWFGKLEVFDSNNNLILTRRSEDALGSPVAATQHVIKVDVVNPLVADTDYRFKVTATDPTDPNLSFASTNTPFATGAQVLSNVRVESITTTGATIAWDANVIGFGAVAYGTAALDQGPVEDRWNTTNHGIALSGLSPGTTYNFEAANKHAIDLVKLASSAGQFTTQVDVAEVVLTQPDASPRTIEPNQISAVSVVAKDRGTPVAGLVVDFAIDAASDGGGAFGTASTTQATTDANGRATVQFTATSRGNVLVSATSASARNALKIPVVVRRN